MSEGRFDVGGIKIEPYHHHQDTAQSVDPSRRIKENDKKHHDRTKYLPVASFVDDV